MSKALFRERCRYLCSALIALPGSVRSWRQLGDVFNAGDYMGEFLKGLPVIQNAEGQRFLLPGEWCLFFVILLCLNGKTARDFTVGMGLQKLVRTKDMRLAWRQKWWECLICVTLYFLAAYGGIGVFCVLIGQGGQLWQYLCSADLVLRIGIPLLASWAIAVWQLVISMGTNAVWGIICGMCVLTMSVYFTEWFMPGNYLMKLRVEALVKRGIHMEWMICGLFLCLAAGITAGQYVMKRMDYMQEKGDF